MIEMVTYSSVILVNPSLWIQISTSVTFGYPSDLWERVLGTYLYFAQYLHHQLVIYPKSQ